MKRKAKRWHVWAPPEVGQRAWRKLATFYVLHPWHSPEDRAAKFLSLYGNCTGLIALPEGKRPGGKP